MNDWDQRSFEWELTAESVVFEVGGYEGRWAAEIQRRYHPVLHVFEPQPWAAEKCRLALADPLHRTFVHEYALGVLDGRFPMGEFETDGASFLPQPRRQGAGEMVRIDTFLDVRRIGSVDLMLINIEGYEYDLLPFMIRKGILPRIRNLMVQFHAFADLAGTATVDLRKAIGATHDILWDYGTTLVAWRRKESRSVCIL
jgi:FkbM family methyltransferase